MVKSVNDFINKKVYRSNIQSLMKYFGMDVQKEMRNKIKGRQPLKDVKTFVFLHSILES